MINLAEFLFRLTFGMALAMLCVSARRVTSGYFRNSLYATLGFMVLAALLLRAANVSPWTAIAAATFSYVGAICWLYEKPLAGYFAMTLLGGAALWGAGVASGAGSSSLTAYNLFGILGSGLLLGFTMGAMLLGHWHLNAPGMSIAPLRRLVMLAAIALAFQTLIAAAQFHHDWMTSEGAARIPWAILALRWIPGLVATGVLLWMARAILKIPNTQSATGVLFVAVITTFIGELTALLLSQPGSG